MKDKPKGQDKADQLMRDVARETGVDDAAVKRVMEHLGLRDALALVSKQLGREKIAELRSKQIVVGVFHAGALIAM